MSFVDDPARFSSLVAPAIDRIAISVHAATDPERIKALRGENRFHPGALALMAGPLATGSISASDYLELTRYEHFGAREDFVNGMVDRGAVEVSEDGTIVTTPAALEVSRGLIELQQQTMTKLLAARQDLVDRLSPLLERASSAAIADPMSVLSKVQGRSWTPADPSPAAQIWQSTLVLRMHRSDAHAAAWSAAGHTAKEMKALPSGPERDAIEVRTNELAAAPWQPFTADERCVLLANLAGLPGTGAPLLGPA